MSFFKKLKSKLFKSSAKLEAGLDAIIDEKLELEAQLALKEEETDHGDLTQNIDEVVQENISLSDGSAPSSDQIMQIENGTLPGAEVPVPEQPYETLEVDITPLNPLPEKASIFARTPRRVLDDDMLEQLEELLISSDMGVDTAVRITANLAEGRFGKKLSTADIKIALAQEIVRVMEPVARPLPIYEKTPQVIL